MANEAQLTTQQRTRRRASWSAAAREGVAEKISTLWQNPSYRERMMLAMREGHARKRRAKGVS